MTDSATVLPIKPRRDFKIPKPIGAVLDDYQDRIDEVRSILKLLQQHALSPPDCEIDDGLVMGAVDAAIRLLAPVESLRSAHELALDAARLEKTNA
jgi:hypothetical protein